MLYYQQSSARTMSEFKTSARGLSTSQVSALKKQFGPNTVRVGSVPLWKKLLEPFIDIFAVVLLAAIIISLWQNETLDAVIIAVVLAISAGIFYVQRFSTERVLRNLNKQTEQLVLVTRNNKAVRVNSGELVPGDIVSLTEGEKVPADIRIIAESNLIVDESVLTGESLPVEKSTELIRGEKQIYEQANMLFSGSFIVGGNGKGVVVATGNTTQFGNIATLSERTETKSPVQQKIDKLVSRVVAIVAALAVVTFALALLRGLDIAESLRFVIALSVSAVPEGLPIAISVILVLGMRRMAAKKALVQQMRAIETLGVVTTIATDKTGTLTENKLTVQSTWQPKKSTKLNEAIGRVINHTGNMTDPLDQALVSYARKIGTTSESRMPAGELPFDQSFAMSATIWHSGADSLIYVKGAPEAILRHSRLANAEKVAAEKSLQELAAKGYRVIGVASTKIARAPKDFTELTKNKLTFEGFVAVADTLRPEASAAIKTALSAGVSVRMITGDHAETAYQIGKSLGMVTRRDEVFDCRELENTTDEKLAAIVKKTKVFARVIPEQKYRLLTILKKHNITAMTGDGVNDVPALTNAHIGIAMGSGSSIARDAGDIILLDDNFKTIIDAIREGRVIIANIRRMLFYLLSTNAGELLTMIGALLIGTRLPLEPVQILWVNLVTDTAMAIPLGLEPAERDTMKHKPDKPNAPLLGRTMIVRMVLIATTIAVLTLATYIFFAHASGHEYAQTMAFAVLIVTQWSSALAARSESDSLFIRLKTMNRSFYIGLSLSIVLQALVFFGPLGSVLHITAVSWQHLAIAAIIALITPIAVSEIHKAISRPGR